jgi:hypothetical protein
MAPRILGFERVYVRADCLTAAHQIVRKAGIFLKTAK